MLLHEHTCLYAEAVKTYYCIYDGCGYHDDGWEFVERHEEQCPCRPGGARGGGSAADPAWPAPAPLKHSCAHCWFEGTYADVAAHAPLCPDRPGPPAALNPQEAATPPQDASTTLSETSSTGRRRRQKMIYLCAWCDFGGGATPRAAVVEHELTCPHRPAHVPAPAGNS